VTGLLGVAVVALYLNTTSLGSIAAGDSPTLLAPETVFFNVVSLGVAVVMAPVGRYVGDRLAVDVFALSGAKQLEGELSGVVRAVGRFTAVTLPSVGEIGDMDTYDPVSPEKKAELAETTLLFPRKLSVEDLRERLVARLKEEYGVGYVDIDLGTDGTVEYFAVGSRAAGLGPTLARDRRRSRWLRIRRTTPPPATRSSCGGTIPSRNTSQPGNYAGSPPTPSPSRSTSRTPNA